MQLDFRDQLGAMGLLDHPGSVGSLDRRGRQDLPGLQGLRVHLELLEQPVFEGHREQLDLVVLLVSGVLPARPEQEGQWDSPVHPDFLEQ